MRIVTNRGKMEAKAEKRRRIRLVRFCRNLRIPFDLSRLRQIVIILVVRLLTEGLQVRVLPGGAESLFCVNEIGDGIVLTYIAPLRLTVVYLAVNGRWVPQLSCAR
jgi:hypothetical protein